MAKTYPVSEKDLMNAHSLTTWLELRDRWEEKERLQDALLAERGRHRFPGWAYAMIKRASLTFDSIRVDSMMSKEVRTSDDAWGDLVRR